VENNLDLKWAYHVIGADHADTAESLKDRYRTLVKTWHPDKFANDPVMRERAEKKMKQINSAYQMVRDAPLRSFTPRQEETPRTAPGAQHYSHTAHTRPYTPSSSGRRRRRRRSAAEATQYRRRTAASFRFFWGAVFGLIMAAYINVGAKFPDHEWELAIWIFLPLFFGWMNRKQNDSFTSEFANWFTFLWW